MRLLDRLVLKELWGPWLFGVGMFTALILAGTYLGRIAGFIADGANPLDVVKLFALSVPAMLVKTFAMAMLLGALLAFGRLSGDSELTAVHAGGSGIMRLLRPVAGFALFVAVASFFFNELVVPKAYVSATDLTEKIVRQTLKSEKRDRSFAKDIVQDGRMQLGLVARDVNPDTGILTAVTATAYGKSGEPTWIMKAESVEFQGEDDWRIRGRATMISGDFTRVISLNDGLWPTDAIPKPKKGLKDLLAAREDQFDAVSMPELAKKIEAAKRDGTSTFAAIRNMEFGYWNKVSLPLASVVFGLLGAVLGVRKARTGAAAGFSLCIAIIFGYVMLTNFMNVWNQAGIFPAWVGTFLPLVVCLGLTVVVAWRRHL